MTDKRIKSHLEDRLRRLESIRNEREWTTAELGDIACCKQTLTYIDSMQEEPVSEELEEVSKEWLRPQLDKSYANYGEAKMMELTHFDGYAMLDAIEFGAKWKKEQFEKNRLKHCNSITNEQAELEQGFIDQHLDKHQRMPTFLDAIEYGMSLQEEQIEEALLSEVLPCFMHGGEADEVVAKLNEVLN